MTLKFNHFIVVNKLIEYANIEEAYLIYLALLNKYSEEEIFNIVKNEAYAIWPSWDDIIVDIFHSKDIAVPEIYKYINQNRNIFIALLEECDRYVEIGDNVNRKGMVLEILKE